MSFDEEDLDPHGECRREIRAQAAEIAALRKQLAEAVFALCEQVECFGGPVEERDAYDIDDDTYERLCKANELANAVVERHRARMAGDPG